MTHLLRPVSAVCAESGAGVQSFGKMGLGPRGGMPARPWGQRIGSNDKHNEWKLFIGQVPLEVRLLPQPCWGTPVRPVRPEQWHALD